VWYAAPAPPTPPKEEEGEEKGEEEGEWKAVQEAPQMGEDKPKEGEEAGEWKWEYKPELFVEWVTLTNLRDQTNIEMFKEFPGEFWVCKGYIEPLSIEECEAFELEHRKRQFRKAFGIQATFKQMGCLEGLKRLII